MTVRDTAKSWGVNLNTWVSIIASLVTIATTGCIALWVTANRSRDIDDLKEWKVAHELLHKDLRTDRATKDARFDERLKALEDRQSTTEGDLKTVTYRTTATEQSVGSVVSSIKELTTSVNLLTGDVRVVREIVQRQDDSSNRSLK